MHRRHFLSTSTLAALGATVATGGQFAGKIKKAVKYHMIGEDLSVADKFRLVQDLGFDGLEIATREKVDPNEVEDAVQAVGLPVHGVVHSSSPDIPGAIDLSKRFGGTSVLVVARYDKSLSLQENWDRDVARYKEAAPHAEKQGIKILVENVWASYLISAFDMKSFLGEIGSDWVQLYFDVGNNVRWGVPEHWIQLLASQIVKLDIKEYSTMLQVDEGLRAGFGVPIGQGSVNWENVRAELANVQFSGWATAEVKGGNRERLAEIASEMNQVLDL